MTPRTQAHITAFGIMMAMALIITAFAQGATPLEHAAIEALRVAKHTDVEYGGMIVRRQTDYGAAYVYIEMPAGERTSVMVIDRKRLLEGDVLVGIYHTHLCLDGYAYGLYSKTDVITAVFSGLTSFMLDECSGLVHEFNAKVDNIKATGEDVITIDDDGTVHARHLPAGRIVGDIGKKEPLQQP
jgi:hypothetical protein